MAHIVNLDRVVKSFNVTVGIYEDMMATKILLFTN